MQSALVTFKNPAFAEEREWRAVAMGPLGGDCANIAFRSSSGNIAPYEPLDLWGGGVKKRTALPIVSIAVGPRADASRAVNAVRDLVQKRGYGSSVEIHRSGVPLR